MQITQLNVGLITDIPFHFSQKYQTVPRPNRRACYSVCWNAIDFCRLYTSKENLNVGPANRPAFCRQVPRFYAKCPSKNILQVGRPITIKFAVRVGLYLYIIFLSASCTVDIIDQVELWTPL